MDSLRVEGLRKSIGDFVLEADIVVGAGERAAITGPSGSGKTSLLKIIAGLLPLQAPEDQGRILFGSTDVTTLATEKRGVGMVFQEQALFPTLSVLDNITFGLRMRGVPRKKRLAQASPWLEKVGLANRANDSTERLSGGERQRIAFVRAILWKPRVILLDEPFSAMDTALRQSIRSELVDLHRLWPVPLLLVTHDQADVDAVATKRYPLTLRGATRRIISENR